MLGVKRFRWHRSISQVVVVGVNTGEPKAKRTPRQRSQLGALGGVSGEVGAGDSRVGAV
ncbi:hypothetical protein L842_0702 [Mycobacterium intracellulare MIN_052511_1280]|jgi:hypothetical protein|nr:hypothetical protein L842_0702 [Mycobacterium intracellulare MIN_052511_1280]